MDRANESSAPAPVDAFLAEKAAAAAAVASLAGSAGKLDTSAAAAADWRRFLADTMVFAHGRLVRLQEEELERLAVMGAERRALLDDCSAQIGLLSDMIDIRRVAARDSEPRTKALGSIGELEVTTRARLQAERQAARGRLFRIRRLLEGRVLP